MFLARFVLSIAETATSEVLENVQTSPFVNPISYKKLCYRKEDSASVVLS